MLEFMEDINFFFGCFLVVGFNKTSDKKESGESHLLWNGTSRESEETSENNQELSSPFLRYVRL
jgi:hypothetical protein